MKTTDPTIYTAIYKNGEFTAVIEYSPVEGGAVVILSIDIRANPIPPFRSSQRKRRRGHNWTTEEDSFSAILPILRREGAA